MPINCPKLTNIQIKELRVFKKETISTKDLNKANAVLMINDNIDIQTIENITDLKRSRIFSLRSSFLTEGIKILISQPKNPKRLLTKNQLDQVQNDIKHKSPVEYGYDSPFWSTPILADHIFEEFGVKYKSKTSLYIIFKKINFTYHKPSKVYVKRDEQLIQDWKQTYVKQIEEYLKDSSYTVLFEDESIISSVTTTQKIWLEANNYPKIEVSNKRENVSIYGFLNIETGKQHAFMTERQNMYETVKILKKIRQIYPKKDNKVNKLKGKTIVLIWDNAGWHRGSKVQEYIKKDGNIIQIFLPPYSPDLNPQEHVWKEGKEKVTKNKYIPDVKKTGQDFVDYLNNSLFRYSFCGIMP